MWYVFRRCKFRYRDVDRGDRQLVEPINQTVEEDTMIPGLCAFLLGVIYEFNREPGEVTR